MHKMFHYSPLSRYDETLTRVCDGSKVQQRPKEKRELKIHFWEVSDSWDGFLVLSGKRGLPQRQSWKSLQPGWPYLWPEDLYANAYEGHVQCKHPEETGTKTDKQRK
jgi:hypothetical protein